MVYPDLSNEPIRPTNRHKGQRATVGTMSSRGLMASAEEAEDDEPEEVQIEEERDADVEPLKTAPDPGQPTERQLEDHRRTHVPFRLWCKWCVLGRGRGLQHMRCTISLVPIVGIYFFITSGGIKTRRELIKMYGDELMVDEHIETDRKEGKIVKCMVIRCFKTKIVFGHVVPQKGEDEHNYATGLIVQALQWLGHTRMILKNDGEPAIQALTRKAVELAKVKLEDLEQLSKENPVAYDSQSNGATEVGVRNIRGLFRTLKLCFEARLGKFIPITHATIPWLMEHTCLLLNVTVRGTDGLTSWQRVRGRPFRQQLLNFGENVLYKFPGKGPEHHPTGNMGAQGSEGVFTGYNVTSNTFKIATASSYTTARSITRRPVSDRWNADAVAQIRVTPWSLAERPEPRVTFHEPAVEAGPAAETAAPEPPRRLRIDKADLERHGYDEDCKQCRYIRAHGEARRGSKHSERCRTRIEQAIAETEAGKALIAVQEERINRAIAERIEFEDKAKGQRPAVQGDVQPGPAADGDRHRAADEPRPAVAGAGPAAPAEEPNETPAPEDPPWEDVPGGHEAPATPTHAPQGDEPMSEDEAAPEVAAEEP